MYTGRAGSSGLPLCFLYYEKKGPYFFLRLHDSAENIHSFIQSVLMDKKQSVTFCRYVRQPFRETALAKNAIDHIISAERILNFPSLCNFVLQVKINCRIHRLNMILTLSGKYQPVLMIYSHDIDLCIAFIIIKPIGTNEGRDEIYRSLFAEIGKDIFTYIFICKRCELLCKIFADLIQNDLHIVQFTFVWINIMKPKTHKIVGNEIQPFSGFCWILFRNWRLLFNKAEACKR